MTFFLQDVNGCQALLRKLYGFLSLFFVVNGGKGHKNRSLLHLLVE
jgi:uncharacterized membrane protein YdbT with pleckstrin-like domain